MATEGESLRNAKTALERDLASGLDPQGSRQALEAANLAYKNASVQVRKHAYVPKAKGKAKAAAAPAGTPSA